MAKISIKFMSKDLFQKNIMNKNDDVVVRFVTVVAVVAIGLVGLAVCLTIICCGVVCLRRYCCCPNGVNLFCLSVNADNTNPLTSLLLRKCN